MAVTEQEMEDAIEESFGQLKRPELAHAEESFGQKVLKHYGVKGMKWGVRRDTIVDARRSLGKVTRQSNQKEQEYLRTRDKHGVDAPETVAARKELEAAYVKQTKTALTANTLTRGEQLALVLITGPIGASYVAGNAFGTRNSQKVEIRRDIDKMLANYKPDDDD